LNAANPAAVSAQTGTPANNNIPAMYRMPFSFPGNRNLKSPISGSLQVYTDAALPILASDKGA
jgi:hypothetical protein